MDDNTPRAEFPIGDSGKTVILSRPTNEQMFLISLSRQPKSANESRRLVQRLFGVLEILAGEDQWYDLIEDGMLRGDFRPEDVIGLTQQVMKFDWPKEGQASEEDPAPAAPERPAPRLVSGG